MSNWEKLDDVSKSIADEPWSLYWREFDAASDEFRKFMDDPISVLASEIDEVQSDWRVQTNIFGHQIGLTRGAVCTPTITDPRSKTVMVSMYKH
jgi:hypothetical protein